jgi:nitroimidazol reductase NimA-like FMN-containing flavoprotein (pyridoxamine 5'-phosphate oxidase superfamily)
MTEVKQMATTREPAGSRDVLADDLPGRESPGPAPAAGSRELRRLSPEECFGLLEPGGVGRVGFTSSDGIVMLPVNFAVAGKTIIFRTGPDTLLAARGNAPVSFEADRLDETHREGWSVLVQGHAHQVTGEQEVRRLEHATRLEPWAGGARDVYVRITPARISGRRIQQTGPGLPGA